MAMLMTRPGQCEGKGLLLSPSLLLVLLRHLDMRVVFVFVVLVVDLRVAESDSLIELLMLEPSLAQGCSFLQVNGLFSICVNIYNI